MKPKLRASSHVAVLTRSAFMLLAMAVVGGPLTLGALPQAHAQSETDLLGTLPGDDDPKEKKDEPKEAATKEPAAKEPAAKDAEPEKKAEASKKEKAAQKAKQDEKKREQLQARKDIIKSVQRRPVLKRHRFELSAAGSMSINDSLYLVMAFQGSGHFFLSESLSIGLGVVYFLGDVSLGGVDDVRVSEQAVPSIFERPDIGLNLEFTINPLYGKLAFHNSPIVHFDFYLIGGMGVVANFQKTGRPCGVFGIGQRFNISRWLNIKWELRDYIFNDNVQSEYGTHSDIQHYVLLSVGVGFFVPPTFSYRQR